MSSFSIDKALKIKYKIKKLDKEFTKIIKIFFKNIGKRYERI